MVLNLFGERVSETPLQLLLAAVRASYLGSVSVALASLVVAWLLLPASLDGVGALRRRLLWLSHCCLPLAMLLALGWWPLIGVQMTGVETLGEVRPYLEVILFQTFFGGELRVRLALLALAWVLVALACWSRLNVVVKELRGAALVVLALVALLQPMMGHGASIAPGYLWPMTVHVLAAALWLGSLPGLLIGCILAPSAAGVMLSRFSLLGMGCVVALLISGLFQSAALVGSWEALFNTSYGVLVLLKGILFLGLLALAAINRFCWLARAEHSPGGLRVTLGIEILLGCAMLLAAALLAGQPPPGHMGH
ncbi:CopD family protein [Halotalea alkalilenta]|uniref:Copper resistance protein D n=1 Tax=Halotalea alkalilenta TaxID=376489 RepID=A0A172YF19_9GAMM|nr:CopD family protein [Halotalea alkalilenta]ANF57706.1 hypothetical protein A5892_09705 [Halotalea alkalilenta]